MAGRVRSLAALLILLAATCLASPPPDSAEGMLGFADSLRTSGESFRAVTEYLRVLHHFQNDSGARARGFEGLSEAYADAGRFSDAAEALIELYRLRPEPSVRQRLGEALFRAGRSVEAADLLLSGTPTPFESSLGTLAFLKKGGGSPPARADLALIEKYERLPQKNALTAGLLSALLPGAGHLYVDRPHDALLAALINGLFLWGTFEAASRKEWALTGVLGGAELFWYSGTILGSVNGAQKWNNRERERFFDSNLKALKPHWSLGTAGSGFGLSLGFAF